MSSDLDILDELDSTNLVEEINTINSTEEADLQVLVKMLLAEKLKDLEEKALEELSQIKTRQQKMRFLNNLLRLLNSTKDKDDGIDFEKHPEFYKIRDEALQMANQSEELEKEAEKLENEAADLLNKNPNDRKTQMDAKKKEGEAKAKRDEAAEMRDISKAVKILSEKKKISKDEKVALIENVRTVFDDLNSINNMQIQASNKLNNERHETLLMARMIMKTLHESIVHMARGAGGRG